MTLVLMVMCFTVALAMSFLIIPRVLVVAYRKRLFDYPNERKVHKAAVPRLGGFSFLPSILFSLLFSFGVRYLMGFEVPTGVLGFIVPELYFLFCGLILLYLAGIKDDLIGLRYRAKFLIQIIAVCLLPLSGLWINNLYGLFGIHELSPWIGIPFTVLVVVFIINAINLIDGIDGLASGLSIISLLVMATLFYVHGAWTYAMLAFAALGTLIPFFYYNVFGKAEHCRKIFMGDTGSLTMGYLLAFLVVRYSSCHPELVPCSEDRFVIAFSTLLVPIFDVFRVMLVRARNSKHIFKADKNHFHHKLLAIGLTPRKGMMSILMIAVAFICFNFLLASVVNNTILLLGDIAIWIGLNLWLDKVRDKKIVGRKVDAEKIKK